MLLPDCHKTMCPFRYNTGTGLLGGRICHNYIALCMYLHADAQQK